MLQTMQSSIRKTSVAPTLAAIVLATLLGATSAARAEAADTAISLADGAYSIDAPEGWKRQEPSVRIIDAEFQIPAVEGDENDGRMTVMGAGGSIDQNVERWIGQFKQADGGNTKERTKTEKKEIAGTQVHLVDIAGTFSDRRGPFAPAVERADYRMLAAIIETKKSGNYFVKFYGPRKTVAENEAAFAKMIDSLRKK